MFKNISPVPWKSAVLAFFVSLAAICVVSALDDWETVGAAAVVAVFVLPPIGSWCFAKARWSRGGAGRIGFALGMLPALVLLIPGALGAAGGADAGVVEAIARWALKLFLVGCVAAFVVLFVAEQKTSNPAPAK